jgi:putative salt-induced outer membrane protein YdiY
MNIREQFYKFNKEGTILNNEYGNQNNVLSELALNERWNANWKSRYKKYNTNHKDSRDTINISLILVALETRLQVKYLT